MKSYSILLLLLFITTFGFSQKDNKLIREGNKLYKEGKYKDAEVDYRKALEINKESVKGKFNLGTSVYQQKNFNESTKIFDEMATTSTDKKIKAEAFHNLGNSLLEAKEYEKSIQAYKNALLNNPSDKDTKYNLEYAKKMLKQQQQQQQQQKQNQDKKDQDKKDQEKKDQQDQNKDQNQDQKKNQNQDQNKKISKEDAERMLEALKNDEKKTMAKVKKAKVQQVKIEKDW